MNKIISDLVDEIIIQDQENLIQNLHNETAPQIKFKVISKSMKILRKK